MESGKRHNAYLNYEPVTLPYCPASVILSITCQNCYTAVRVIRLVNRDRTLITSPALEKRVAIDNIKGLLISGVYLSVSYWIFGACRLKNMRTRNSCLAENMRPREKTCVPIRVILRFRELCWLQSLKQFTSIFQIIYL